VPLLRISPAGQGDEVAGFLADFRALRESAALDLEELSARAHYPGDILKEAESGPDLPSLPLLAAYVRACGDDVAEWEERWRRVADAAGSDSGLPVRPAGASPAAKAGARVTVAPAEVHDAERIKAALRGRGHRERGQAGVRDGGQPSSTVAGSAGDIAPAVTLGASEAFGIPGVSGRLLQTRVLVPVVLVLLIACVLVAALI
jgi:hypothetical protein